jgi:hypothetical protein
MPRHENHTEWGGRFYGSIPQNYLRAKLKRGKVSVLIDTQHYGKNSQDTPTPHGLLCPRGRP